MGALQRGWDLVSGKVARESKERFEEAQRIVDNAKERYERTVEHFEAASQQARVIADAYGEYRVECMTSDIRGYVSAYSRFANLEYSSDLPAVVDYNLPMNNTRFVEELSLSSRSAFEIKANIPMAIYTAFSFIASATKTIITNANLQAEEYRRITMLYEEATAMQSAYQQQILASIDRYEQRVRRDMRKLISSFAYDIDTGRNYDNALRSLTTFARSMGIVLQYTDYSDFEAAMVNGATFRLE